MTFWHNFFLHSGERPPRTIAVPQSRGRTRSCERSNHENNQRKSAGLSLRGQKRGSVPHCAEYFALNRRFFTHFPAAVINTPRAVGAPKPPLASLIQILPRRTSAFPEKENRQSKKTSTETMQVLDYRISRIVDKARVMALKSLESNVSILDCSRCFATART